MDFYSVKHWEEHWDELIDRVEKGDTIGVVTEDGQRAVFVPADDEIIRMYTEHEEGS